MKTNVLKSIGIGIALATALSTAHSQSFNIDLDIFGGTPEIGNGAPSNAFGAAANQPGRWNRVNGSASIPIQLFGLDGNPTNVWITASGGTGSSGGWNNPLNTGDYALLLNDATIISHSQFPTTWTFTGLGSGHYRLFTYAVSPVPGVNRTIVVDVSGSHSPNPQQVVGPMPGNSFSYLITHAVHEVEPTKGILEVTAYASELEGYVNGFQLVAVPEPSTVLSALLVLAKRRSKPVCR